MAREAIDAIRASLDAQVVRESARLNSQMVLLTISISGGPFLGLLMPVDEFKVFGYAAATRLRILVTVRDVVTLLQRTEIVAPVAGFSATQKKQLLDLVNAYVEPLPEDRAAAATFRHGRGNFQLHYALDRSPDWLTPGLDDVALIHLADGIDSVSKSANEAERGLLPVTPTICVGQPHRLDPSRAPQGKAVLWLQIPDAPRILKGDAAAEIETTPDWTEATREAFADRIERILSRHIRGFDRIKLSRRAYSPADLAAMNMNLVGGDPYGGACSIDQFFVWRPFAQSTNGTFALRGLRHIGASTHPGPGLGGGSGYLAAKALGA